MVIISSLNSQNYSGVSTPGHIIGVGSGLLGVTGVTSSSAVSTNIPNQSAPSTITSMNSLNAGGYSTEDFDKIKECIAQTDTNVQRMYAHVENEFALLNQAFESSELKMDTMFSSVNTELDKIRLKIEMKFEDGMLPLEEDELNIIYECFILPYIQCEIYRMGTIKQIIDLNVIINGLIQTTQNPKTKLILNIFKDMLKVFSNIRNDYMKTVQLNNQLELLQIKYHKCNELVMTLETKLKKLTGELVPQVSGILSGTLSFVVWKPPPLIYVEAKFNLDLAWYKYLYNTPKIDPDKYQATIAYVRFFGTKEKAYAELIRLLDEKYKTFEDDFKEAYKNKVEEVEDEAEAEAEVEAEAEAEAEVEAKDEAEAKVEEAEVEREV